MRDDPCLLELFTFFRVLVEVLMHCTNCQVPHKQAVWNHEREHNEA
jgi:hypothetical protein